MDTNAQYRCVHCGNYQTQEQPTVFLNIKIYKCFSCSKTFSVKVVEVFKPTPTNEKIETCVESRNMLDTSGRSERLRQDILNYITHQYKNGATCKEVETALSVRHESCSCTIRFLTQDGFLLDSKTKRVNQDTGRNAIVWVASQFIESMAS